MKRKLKYVPLLLLLLCLSVTLSGCLVSSIINSTMENLQKVERVGNYTIVSTHGLTKKDKASSFIDVLEQRIKIAGEDLNNPEGDFDSYYNYDQKLFFLYRYYSVYNQPGNYALGYFDYVAGNCEIIHFLKGVSYDLKISLKISDDNYSMIRWGGENDGMYSEKGEGYLRIFHHKDKEFLSDTEALPIVENFKNLLVEEKTKPDFYNVGDKKVKILYEQSDINIYDMNDKLIKSVNFDFIKENSEACRKISEIFDFDIDVDLKFKVINNQLFFFLKSHQNEAMVGHASPPIIFKYDIDSENPEYIGYSSYVYYPIIDIFE